MKENGSTIVNLYKKNSIVTFHSNHIINNFQFQQGVLLPKIDNFLSEALNQIFTCQRELGALALVACMVSVGFASNRGPGPPCGYWVPATLKGVPHCKVVGCYNNCKEVR